MQQDVDARQQVVDKIKSSTNILVTVGHDPSVDSLASAIALSLMLNKLDKHATAIFSGQIPLAINFLKPDATFENNVDSLRDFIIALDKDKADRLRYKVEGNMVRVFITPYRTTISEKDLQFSYGDYNVELVIALGVERKDELDSTIIAHGKILHDAAVITINNREEPNDLGQINWNDRKSSSLGEMLMTLSGDLQKNIIDEQIATALLTGIVAATDRFSNSLTSSQTMTLAAKLMGMGANQQLISAKLQENHEVKEMTSVKVDPQGLKSPKLSWQEEKDDNQQLRVEQNEAQLEPVAPEPQKLEKATDGDMQIMHERVPNLPDNINNVSEFKSEQPTLEPKLETAPQKPEFEPLSQVKSQSEWSAETPMTGGTLNATTQDAEEDRINQENDERNRVILKHDSPVAMPEPKPEPIVDHVPTLAEIDRQARGQASDMLLNPNSTDSSASNVNESNISNARAAVDAALNGGLPPLFQSSQVQQSPPQTQQDVAQPQPVAIPSQPELPSFPAPPPLPDFSTLPPPPPEPGIGQHNDFNSSLPDINQPDSLSTNFPSQPQPQAPTSTDPGQFRIPGQ
jgi:hypothetical protein